MDLATFRALLTPAGQQVLGEAAAADREAGDDVAAALSLQHSAADRDLVAAALTQVSLRKRAAAKFGDRASRMYFTPETLEQASTQRVAAHRASRIAAAAPESVIDLGCGIGGDLVALADTGLVTAGVDVDPLRVAIAEANLEGLGLAGAVAVADATTVDVDRFGLAFADPARRGGRGRTFDPDRWDPPWSFVERLLAGRAVVKVAPGIDHDLVPAGVEAEWVSEAGDVKEAALWSPALATAVRRATVLGRRGLATLTEEDDPFAGVARPVRPLGTFLYEPDGAVIRAGLVTAVAAGVQGGLLDAHIAYVTSDAAFRTPFARGYRVVEVLPYREKHLRQALRERGIGTLTIKKRGVGVEPAALRRRLALSGDGSATLVLTRAEGAGVAILVEPF